MTLGELKEKVEASFSETGLSLATIFAPIQRIEVAKDKDSDDKDEREGIGASAATLYHPHMKGTHENLDRGLAELILQKTTRTKERPLLDPPVSIEGKRMFSGLTFTLQDAEGTAVDTATIYLKMVEFEFLPFEQRPPYSAHENAWLEEFALDERLAALEAAKVVDDERAVQLARRVEELEARLAS
jgi:hypothetical protein